MPVLKLTHHIITNELRCPEGKTKSSSATPSCPACTSWSPRRVQVAVPTSCGTRTPPARRATRRSVGPPTSTWPKPAREQEPRAEIALGADPRGEAKAQKEVPTLDAFFTEQYEPFAKPRKRSFARDDELYRLRIKGKFGNRRLNQISRQQIQSFHTELLALGLAPATCDHHLKLLKRVFNLAIDWGVFPGPNPVARVPMLNVDNKVEHYLDDDELQRLVTVLRSDENRPVCLIALFLLSTGRRLTRPSRRRGTSSTGRTASGGSRRSTRSRSACAPCRSTTARSRCWRRSAPTASSARVRQRGDREAVHDDREGVVEAQEGGRGSHLRLHDLRHSFASFLVNEGRTLYEVQQILGHSDAKVTERYAHLSKQDPAGRRELGLAEDPRGIGRAGVGRPGGPGPGAGAGLPRVGPRLARAGPGGGGMASPIRGPGARPPGPVSRASRGVPAAPSASVAADASGCDSLAHAATATHVQNYRTGLRRPLCGCDARRSEQTSELSIRP